MTPEERVALLEQLELKDELSQRRAGWVAWGSVGVAAIVLGVMIFAGYQHLTQVKARVKDAQDHLSALESQTAQSKAELQRTQEQLQTARRVLAQVRPDQAKAAFEEVQQRYSKTADFLPRLYLQIVNANDRPHADEIAKKLKEGGFVVLGIEYVQNAISTKETEVRYYKKVDEKEAGEIVNALIKAGEPGVTTKNLHLDSNAKFPANRFEIWFPDRHGQP